MRGFLLPERPVASLDDHLARGGGAGLEAARRLGPDSVVEELEAAGLRGRGGAGFPTGRKWRSILTGGGTHHYAVCNAAEGEPSTFKDRALLRADPYRVVEGLAVAAATIGAREAYVALKASFVPEQERVSEAVAEMSAAGLLGDLTVSIVAGPEDYLFGEETALLEVVEGKEALPRLFPPYVHGLFATAPQMGWTSTPGAPGHEGRHESNPTLVNNVETLANVPLVMERGADWFRSYGTPGSPGTVVATVVGDVVRPRVLEVEMGTPLSELLAAAGGLHPGRSLKAVLSGVANPVLTAGQVGTPLTYEDMEAAGTGLGAAGFAVYDDTACMVRVAHEMSRFLAVESCGQCPPCKLGSADITWLLHRIEAGEGDEADVERMGARLRWVTDGNRCFLAVQEQRVVASVLRAFPGEVADHLERGCPFEREIHVPKVVDMGDGFVVYAPEAHEAPSR